MIKVNIEKTHIVIKKIKIFKYSTKRIIWGKKILILNVLSEDEIKMREEDEEEEADLDMFAEIGEEEDDKEDIKAAVTSGLLSAGVKREEERMAEETARQERQEEAKRNQLLLKEQQELSKLERFKRLKSLLNKSKIYSELIMKKMKSHEAGLALKAKAVEERNKKRADKQADSEEPEKKKGNKRGRKKAEEEETESKRRKLNEEASKVAKDRSENQRKFEGREIPENQPLLLSGGIMRSYQLEGYEWMATLWEKGINGILADEMGLG